MNNNRHHPHAKYKFFEIHKINFLQSLYKISTRYSQFVDILVFVWIFLYFSWKLCVTRLKKKWDRMDEEVIYPHKFHEMFLAKPWKYKIELIQEFIKKTCFSLTLRDVFYIIVMVFSSARYLFGYLTVTNYIADIVIYLIRYMRRRCFSHENDISA